MEVVDVIALGGRQDNVGDRGMAPPVVPALSPIVIDESPTISILDLAEGIDEIRGGSRVTRARTRIISGFSKAFQAGARRVKKLINRRGGVV